MAFIQPNNKIKKKNSTLPERSRACYNCDWWTEDMQVCCNGDSKYRADFTAPDFYCKDWEATMPVKTGT